MIDYDKWKEENERIHYYFMSNLYILGTLKFEKVKVFVYISIGLKHNK